MAAPFVAGAFAILMAEGYTAQKAREQLTRTAIRYFPSIPVVNIANALSLPEPEPIVEHEVSFADLNDNGQIDDEEAMSAIRAWINRIELNGTFVTDGLVQMIIQAWIAGTKV